MKILLAIDDSKYSEAAVQAVLQQMKPDASEVCILHVVKPLLIIPRSYIGQVENLEAAQQERLKEGKELVERTGQLLSQAGFKVHTDVEEGDPRSAIIDYAARWYADLIMTGSHGKTGLDKLLIGSVSEAVLRHAHCSVEIVRPAEVRDAQVLQNTSARSRRSSSRTLKKPNSAQATEARKSKERTCRPCAPR